VLGSPTCKRCVFAQIPAIGDAFYEEAVRPFCYFASVCLFISYVIGLLFTLKTHAAVIWESEQKDEKKVAPAGALHQVDSISRNHTRLPTGSGIETVRRPASHDTVQPGDSVRDSPLYKRILGQSLKQTGTIVSESTTPHIVPPKTPGTDGNDAGDVGGVLAIPSLNEEQNGYLERRVAEIAATAATVAAHESLKRRKSATGSGRAHHPHGASGAGGPVPAGDLAAAESKVLEAGGHDAPNWGRGKSAAILMSATVLYAVVAEILVNTVDVVLTNVSIDEKFLGITLFALVPNTTEFLVSFGPRCAYRTTILTLC
jgi:Ca2+:H+ antiporter